MIEKKGKVTPPPTFRPPSDYYIRNLHFDKDTLIGLKDYFMGNPHHEGKLVRELNKLSKHYFSLPVEDIDKDRKDYFYSVCEPGFHYFDEIYNELKEDHYPNLNAYLAALTALTDADREITIWQQIKSIFEESTGLENENFIELIKKSRELAKRGKSFNDGPKGKRKHFHMTVLREIVTNYFNQYGTKPTLNDVLDIIAIDYSGQGGLIELEDDIDREDKILYYYPRGYKEGIVNLHKMWKFKTIDNRIGEIIEKLKK